MTEEKRPRHYDEEDLLTADQLQEIEEKFDPELRFRDLLQPVAILAGAPWSLGLLNQPHMQLVRGLCRFIMVCCPLMLLEKWWTSRRSRKSDASGARPNPPPRAPGWVDTADHTPKH